MCKCKLTYHPIWFGGTISLQLLQHLLRNEFTRSMQQPRASAESMIGSRLRTRSQSEIYIQCVCKPALLEETMDIIVY